MNTWYALIDSYDNELMGVFNNIFSANQVLTGLRTNGGPQAYEMYIETIIDGEPKNKWYSEEVKNQIKSEILEERILLACTIKEDYDIVLKQLLDLSARMITKEINGPECEIIKLFS